MKMKSIKRKLAVLLAVLLLLPTQPVVAAGENAAVQEEQQESETASEKETASEEEAASEEKSDALADEEEQQESAEETKDEDAEKENASDDEADEADVDAVEEESEEDSEEESSEDLKEESSEGSEEESTEDSEEKSEEGSEEDSEEKSEEGSEENSGEESEEGSEEESEKELEEKSEEKSENESEDDSEEDYDNDSEEESEENAEDGDLEEELILDATPSDAELAEPEELVIYNTGNTEIQVVSYEDFVERELGDAYFEEDGSFIIPIPEENPFFPYEVQFTYDEETTNEWFMDPDDTVEIGGHTFGVSGYFDGETVTQINLEAGGKVVVVYPEEKEFKNNGGISMFSLMPLETDSFTADFTGFTPLELTMVKIESVFAGNRELEDTDRIMWCQDGDDYKINSGSDVIDLSYRTYYGGTSWDMIVGAADQLEASNVHYTVRMNTTNSYDWIQSKVYKPEEDGSFSELTVLSSDYEDYYLDDRELWVGVELDEENSGDDMYVKLDFMEESFENISYSEIRAYEGEHASVEEAEASKNITKQLLDGEGEGYLVPLNEDDSWVTLVAYDSDGQAVGCLPLWIYVWRDSDEVVARLYSTSDDSEVTKSGYDLRLGMKYRTRTLKLKDGYKTNETYRLVLEYKKVNPEGENQVTGAYIGKYESLEALKSSGAEDIKEALFDEDQGYLADFSGGVYVTVIAGTAEEPEKLTFTACIMTAEEEYEPSDSTYVTFEGLVDAEGNSVSCQIPNSNKDDDYADHCFITILVEAGTDLTALSPEFSCIPGIDLYATGSKTPEVSGESVHDFSNGPVQYTASSESEEYQKNYWLQVVEASEGEGVLYINSLADPDAETYVENGVTYSKREMFVDSRYGNKHDILLINIGAQPLAELSVELESDQVELDEYWTLTGENDFEGVTWTENSETWNQAKLRLIKKESVTSGSEISGTLTIKAGGETLMVLTLTGIAGDPGIVTADLPDAVKYVHYGTAIQNNNKYDFNTVSYKLTDGSLPDGMVLKKNGELYGVPTETGEFTFSVMMNNSYSEFTSSEAELTLTVIENTDENVDNATDENYELFERVPDITLSNTRDYTMASVGVFDEWVNLYLDGEMLVEGEDYDAESGSTRLTIRSQTLKADNTEGTHTLSAEFRTSDEQVMKRAAQNYHVTKKSASTNTGSSNDDDSSSSSTSSNQNYDAKKGYLSSQAGIITGDGSGYSHWQQDENGWKLIYADGTTAAGSVIVQADGTSKEQVLWEKVNGSYYAFGADGYLSTGWVYDYMLNEWYCISENSGMWTGWYYETQDGCTYYLNPADGALAHGWKQIDGKWYYLNEVSAAPTWIFNPETKTWFYNVASKTKPWGALYRNEQTPDGYQVDENGVWNER